MVRTISLIMLPAHLLLPLAKGMLSEVMGSDGSGAQELETLIEELGARACKAEQD